MLSQQFQDILTNYQARTTQPYGGKDAFTAQITDGIPALLRANLQNGSAYTVKGSVGTGRWADTPWVAVMDPKITTTVQRGYYVCYLINPKQHTMYLGLAVGWTQFTQKFAVQEAQKRIADYSRYLLGQLTDVPSDFQSGTIDLSAQRNSTSAGYEQGQIVYKKYQVDDLDDATLYADLESMLNIYAQLRDIAGANIQNISYDKVTVNAKISESEKLENQKTLKHTPTTQQAGDAPTGQYDAAYYRDKMLSKGFVFVRSQEAWAQHRGLEYIYTHPIYKNQFYVKRLSDEPGAPWGLNAQTTNGAVFDKIVPHNAVDTFMDKGLFAWTGEAFDLLMEKISSGGSARVHQVERIENSLMNRIVLSEADEADEPEEDPEERAQRIANVIEADYQGQLKRSLDSAMHSPNGTTTVAQPDYLEFIQAELKNMLRTEPPERVERVAFHIVRDPNVAMLVKESKGFVCEVCERAPFIQKNGKPYAEADHIRPLGGIHRGLDTPENIRCLCAQCHAIITYGSDEVIKELLKNTKWEH